MPSNPDYQLGIVRLSHPIADRVLEQDDAEVSEHDASVGSQEYVFRLDVAMYGARFVNQRDRFHERSEGVEGFKGATLPFSQMLVQGTLGMKLSNDEFPPDIGINELENRRVVDLLQSDDLLIQPLKGLRSFLFIGRTGIGPSKRRGPSAGSGCPDIVNNIFSDFSQVRADRFCLGI